MLAEITLDRVEIPDGRRAIDPDAVARLKNSIAVVGLQHPITVAKRDGGYRLLAGAHRLTAFRELGMERISANLTKISRAMSCHRPNGRRPLPGARQSTKGCIQRPSTALLGKDANHRRAPPRPTASQPLPPQRRAARKVAFS